VLITVYFSRAEAIERIFAENVGAKDRADFWTSGLQLFWQYFPLGFGPGGFVSAFQITEPLALLDGAYLNRLHNDWLETALTFGVPGILLMLAGAVYYLRRSCVLWMRMDGARSAVALGRMASIVIAILGIASMSDYPLRTPAMAGFAALVLVWFGHARQVPKAG
jgi:O-antigen ligase